MTDFPERLRASRECRGWTQGHRAARAGIPAPSLSLYESGGRSPSLDNLTAIASALDASLDDLVHGRTGGTLTAAERAVLAHLTAAWNDFVLLPDHHPDDIAEFRFRIHGLQDQIKSRPTRRCKHTGEIRIEKSSIMNIREK